MKGNGLARGTPYAPTPPACECDPALELMMRWCRCGGTPLGDAADTGRSESRSQSEPYFGVSALRPNVIAPTTPPLQPTPLVTNGGKSKLSSLFMWCRSSSTKSFTGGGGGPR